MKIGDSVEVTNDYGVDLGVKKIVEIVDGEFGTLYYLAPTDAPWAHWHARNLRPMD